MATVPKSNRSTEITLATPSSGPFNLDFRLFDQEGLKVFVNHLPRTDFTVSANFTDGYDDNASVTFGSELAEGDVIIIDCAMFPHRDDDYRNGPGLTNQLNIELGRIWSALSDLYRDSRRSLQLFGDIAPIQPKAGSAVIVTHSGIEAGPTADEIASAQTHAETTSNNANAAAQSAAQAALFDGPRLDSEEDIEDDSSLTYAEGQPGSISEGDFVQTRKEMFTYQVAAPGSPQFHRENSLGARLLAMRSNGGGYEAQAFGRSTTALGHAFLAAAKDQRPLFLEGDYKLNGALLNILAGINERVHLFMVGEVFFEYDPLGPPLRDLIYLATSGVNYCSITGGTLTIDLNNLVASGITFRHNAPGQGGAINIECPVTILNGMNVDDTATYENQGLMCYGDYARIAMDQVTVDGMGRENTNGGATKGITVAGFSGDFVGNQLSAKRVLTPSLASADADGIAIFGKQIGADPNARAGRAVLNEAYFEDNQGRSLKVQCSDATVYRPKVKRQAVQAIEHCVEFDFQFGNGLVYEPDYEFRKSGGVSPLGASHTCVAFQQKLDDQVMLGKSVGGVLRSEMAVPRYALAVHDDGALYSETAVSGLRTIGIGGYAGTAFERAVLETRGDTIASKAARTKLTVTDVSGALDCALIGYTDYATGDVSAKLSVEVSGNRNTLPISSDALPLKHLNTTQFNELEEFHFFNNQGFRDLLSGAWSFDFSKLRPGTIFTAYLPDVNVQNAPPWGATGSVLVESLAHSFDVNDRWVRVTRMDGTPAQWMTSNGGTTWVTIT